MSASWLSSRLAIYVLSFVAIALLAMGVRVFPPLTQGGLPRSGSQPVGADAAPADPAAWCRATLSNVDCACFAKKATEVMNTPHDPVYGLVYADRWDLARAQATQSC